MERTYFEKIIETINESKLPSVHHLEDLNIDFELVSKGLDVDKHRWYEISTDVYKIGEWFLGVRGASQSYSEMQSWEDLAVDTIAFEMVQVKTVTYKPRHFV